MTAEFDPYREWLNVATDERPPNHYRLLGLEPFEAAASAITVAYRDRLSLVRKRQVGQRGELASELLNELTDAYHCLNDPSRKSDYDRDLRDRLGVSGPFTAAASSPMTRPPAVVDDSSPEPPPVQAAVPIPAAEAAPPVERPSRISVQDRKLMIWAASIVCAVMIPLISLAVLKPSGAEWNDPAVSRYQPTVATPNQPIAPPANEQPTAAATTQSPDAVTPAASPESEPLSPPDSISVPTATANAGEDIFDIMSGGTPDAIERPAPPAAVSPTNVQPSNVRAPIDDPLFQAIEALQAASGLLADEELGPLVLNGPADFRRWTLKQDYGVLTAAYDSSDGVIVRLRQPDGTRHELAVATLIDDDQQWLHQKIRSQRLAQADQLVANARAALRSGNYRAASKPLESARSLLSDDIRAEVLLATITALGERSLPAATAIAANAVKRSPQNVAALNNLAVMEVYNKDFDQALQFWERALGADSRSPSVLHNLSRFVEHVDSRRMNTARSTAERARQLLATFQRPQTMFTNSGWVYMDIAADADGAMRSVDATSIGRFSLEDKRCLVCDGDGINPCSNRRCERGRVTTEVQQFGFNPGTRRPVTFSRQVQSPCITCRGKGSLVCRHCNGGIAN